MAVVTAFAAFLPAPRTQATTSVTDTIVVRVVGSTPRTEITSPATSGEIFVTPAQTISYNYENAGEVTATLIYTDVNGVEHVIDLGTIEPDFNPGSETKNINFGELGYGDGYGDYVLKVKGIGLNGVSYEDIKSFSYYPVTATATQDANTGKVVVDLNYDTSDESKVKYVVVDIYGEDGTTIIRTVTVNYPATTAEIDLDDLNLPDGSYKVTATAYGESGLLYKAFVTSVDYEGEIVVPNTADTGGLFQNANISNTDYLITGMIVFGLVAIAGTAYIVRSDKKKR